ncbi:cytochrome c oxidase subunit 3 [Nocardia sp. NPDC004123]
MNSARSIDAFETEFADPFGGATRNALHGTPRRSSSGPPVPGEVGVWVFVLGDMIVFSVFFGVFAYSRSSQVEVFEQARTTLNLGLGAINTLLLLTGSLFVALAVHAVRANADRLAARLIALALLCGTAFVANKAIEYHSEVSTGHTPGTNDFYMYYFVFTGIHLLHLLLGLVVLTIMWRLVRRRVATLKDHATLESGAIYWHLVDLLWIILFPLLYLAR